MKILKDEEQSPFLIAVFSYDDHVDNSNLLKIDEGDGDHQSKYWVIWNYEKFAKT